MTRSAQPSALIYVQHLLGIGHLARISRVAAALRDHGVRTSVVRGGMPVDGFDVPGVDSIQLDPIRADPQSLDRLVDADGAVFDEARKLRRADALLGLVRQLKPDILLIEAFPFGRRAMRFELVPLVQQARGFGVKVVAASIRDILQLNRKAGRAEETVALINQLFDLVLVHGDEDATPLGASFSLAAQIASRTVYTGIVGSSTVSAPNREHDVIVSVGGGAVGDALISAAVAAAPHSAMADASWLVLTGPNMSDANRRRLAADGAANITFRPFVDDLAARLAGARLSISQAGYNTVADILSTGCRSVLVPFESGGETEQITRANMVAQSGRAVVVREQDLETNSMIAAIDRAILLPPPPAVPVQDGAGNTAVILMDRLAKPAPSSWP